MNANTQVAERKERAPIQVLQDQIMSAAVHDQLKMALPAHISVEKFQRVVVTAVNKAPDLLNGDRSSLFTACVECAQDGLLPNGKEAALVIYSTKQGSGYIKKVQYMPMIQGIYKRARNSGEIVTLNAHLVYTNDEFDYELGFEPKLVHKPVAGDRGDIRFVYAVAVMKDGTRDLEIMTKSEVEEVRKASKASGNGPWVNWWGEMARKTVVRRLAKRLPVSSDLERVISRMDAMYEFDERRQQGPAPARPSRTDATDTSFEIPTDGDDEVPVTETHSLTDAHGDAVGEFDRAGFVDAVLQEIEQTAALDRLDAFWEHNEGEVANLGDARTDADRQRITRAYNEAREKLTAAPKKTARPAADAPQDDMVPADPVADMKTKIKGSKTLLQLQAVWDNDIKPALDDMSADAVREVSGFYEGKRSVLEDTPEQAAE